MTDSTRATCDHCGAHLSRWRVPPECGWDEDWFYVCFNDECPYYNDGWAWMKENYAQHVSYRFVLNPVTGKTSSLPVWSSSAMREMIIRDDDEPMRGRC